jgi:hypothetical protein
VPRPRGWVEHVNAEKEKVSGPFFS